ncbi:LysR family transcriptional regulator [Ottowia sp. VDI28]|uniref:LysR family transcriptional regulator n=1 Tax=Ottowia sp. VDI28 TaxID=3133968 RepID=UPI003C2C1058
MELEWRQLELLRCIIDSGGTAQAARAAGISQPAVSQAMQRLTRQVGEPLFEKQGRRRVPTPRALELAHAMRAAEDSFSLHSGHRGAANPGIDASAVRVGLAPAAGLLYSPAMVNALAAGGKRTKLSIVTGTAPAMLDALKREELDLVITPRPRGLNRADLFERLMYVSQPVIYCRTGHPLANATSLRAIARAQWVVAGQAGTPGNTVEEAFRVRRWAPPRIAVHCADYAMLAQIVAETDLLGTLPHPRLVPQSRLPGIVPLRVDERLPHYEVCLFWPRRPARNSAAIRRLVAALSTD